MESGDQQETSTPQMNISRLSARLDGELIPPISKEVLVLLLQTHSLPTLPLEEIKPNLSSCHIQ